MWIYATLCYFVVRGDSNLVVGTCWLGPQLWQRKTHGKTHTHNATCESQQHSHKGFCHTCSGFHGNCIHFQLSHRRKYNDVIPVALCAWMCQPLMGHGFSVLLNNSIVVWLTAHSSGVTRTILASLWQLWKLAVVPVWCPRRWEMWETETEDDDSSTPLYTQQMTYRLQQ